MVRHFTIGSLSSSPCLLRLLYKHSVSAAGLQERSHNPIISESGDKTLNSAWQKVPTSAT
ncbi:hypothetical protein J6590_097282 [Homalodisca vitripennis]|nr:hypothetical protein J6590_097282 [Homalodisca vitripennis]